MAGIVARRMAHGGMVHRGVINRPLRQIDHEFDLDPPAMFEDQRGGHHVADLQRAGQAHQHDVIAARLQHHRVTGGNIQRLDMFHAGHAVGTEFSGVQHGLGCKTNLDAQEPVGLVAFVEDRHIPRRYLGLGHRCGNVGMDDLQIADPDLVGKGGTGQQQGGESDKGTFHVVILR